MSVINKMLRDLDQRQAAQATAQATPDKPLLRGTASLAAVAKPAASGASPRKAFGAALAVLLLVLSAGAFWWWQQAHPAGSAPVSVAANAAAPSVAAVTPAMPAAAPTTTHLEAPALAPKAAATATAAESTSKVLVLPAKSAAPVTALPTNVAVSATNARTTVPVVAVVKAPAIAAPLPGTAGSMAAASTSPLPPKALAAPLAVSATPASAQAGADPQAHAARQLQAGREALAQAQSLWAAGSHDAATELLQQALGLAEHSGGATSAASVQLVSVLARELGRMQLADGRAAATLELLTRLEPVLGRDADIWALRGNAAQRLGRHQDSVRAYAAALQLRPNEQRWLLGSAVSLAALGQTARATEMADKARGLGPISKEVLAYLRQAGVQISEP